MAAGALIGFDRNAAVASLEHLISSWTDDRRERHTEQNLPALVKTFKRALNLRNPTPLPRTAIAESGQHANLDCSA